jgi:serine/threonine protein kinase
VASAPRQATIGPYVVDAELGRGAAGIVFRVRDPQGKPWALKQLTAVEDARARRRFEREIAALTKLDHPGVVQVHDHGEARGRPYLVMELVEGEPLDQRLARAGFFQPRVAAQLGLGLAEALTHAHDHDVLHRDLKPANVLLDREGRPLLTDFGLTHDMAAAHHSLTRTGVFMGTPGYWPPELAVGELDQVGPASDVYGAGAVLYAILTGRPPIRADTLTEVMARTTTEPPVPPSRINPAIDPALEAICLRCLEKPPQARYPDARTLARALEDYLGREQTRPSRGPLLIATGVLASGVLGAALLILSTAGPAEPPSSDPTQSTAPSPPAVPAAELLEQATALRVDRRLEEALALLDQLLTHDPDDLDARTERAITRALAGDQPGAIADSSVVLERDDQRPVAWRVQASALLQLGEIDRALECYSRAVELDPDEAKAWAQRGMARRMKGQREAAREDFARALAIDPELTPMYSALGSMALEDQGLGGRARAPRPGDPPRPQSVSGPRQSRQLLPEPGALRRRAGRVQGRDRARPRGPRRLEPPGDRLHGARRLRRSRGRLHARARAEPRPAAAAGPGRLLPGAGRPG